MSPFYIPALKPVEAAIGIVRSLLLGKKQSESEAVGQRRPSRPEIIAGRALRAAVQNDKKRTLVRQSRWQVAEHSQRARVWPEARGFGQMTGSGGKRSRRFHARRGLYDVLPLIRPRQQVTLDFAHEVLGVKTPSAFVELSAEHARKQAEALAEQARLLTG